MLRIRALNRESSSEEDIPVIRKEAQEEIALELYNKALCLQSDGQFLESKEILLQLLNQNIPELESQGGLPKSLSTLKYSCHLNIGNIHINCDDFAEALDSYLSASELDGTDVTLWYKIGKLAMKLDRFRQAIYAFTKGLECNESHWPCLDSVISLLYAIKDTLGCLVYISRALFLDSDFTKGLVLRRKIYDENPAMKEYYQCYNPDVTWEEPSLDIEIDEEDEKVILQEIQSLCDRISEVEKSVGPKPLPVIPLPKLLNDYTWIDLGKTLIELHDYITTNNMSHFSIVDISKCMSQNLEAEPMDVDGEGKKDTVKDEVPVDNVTANEELKVEEDKILAQTVTERRFSQTSDNNTEQGQENTPNQTDNDEEQGTEQENDDQEDNFENKSDKRVRNRGHKRKRDLLLDLQVWGWHSKRKAAKKSKPEKDLSVEDALHRIIPKHLLQNKICAEKITSEDSMNTMDIYNLYLKEQSTCLSPTHSPKSHPDQNYFGTEKEKEDVLKLWTKKRECCDAVVLIQEFVINLSKIWNIKWPKPLISIYVRAYNMYREHFDHPQFHQDYTFDEMKDDALATLLYCELVYFNSKRCEHEPIHMSSLGFLQFMSSYDDKWCDEYDLFFMRFNWLRAHMFRKEGNNDLAINALHLVQEVLLETEEKTQKKYVLVLPNCHKCSIITDETNQKIMKQLDMIKSLADLEDLYNSEKYMEVAEIIKITFTSEGSYPKGKMGRPAQLAMLLHSLWFTDLTQCFIWNEECLYEAVEHFIKPAQDTYKWEKVVEKCLAIFYEIIQKETVSVVDSLDEDKRSRLVESLCKIVWKQLHCGNGKALPLGCVTPWILLHYVLLRDEHRQQANKKVSHVKEDKKGSEANLDKSAEISLPPSVAILFSGHEFLGPKGWCLSEKGRLLHFILDTILERLDTPIFDSLRDKIDIHIEQSLFCLYQHPSKKNKMSRHLADHNVDPLPLTWQRSFQLYEFYGPDYLPEFNSFKNASISTDLEQLFLRIIALVPNTCDPLTVLPKVQDVIHGKTDVVHEPFEFPNKVRAIYYLLGDFYFKQKEFNRCNKYFLLDLCINPLRLDSWACLALSYTSQLESKLNYCKKLKSEMEFIDKANCAKVCYKQALKLSNDIVLWIEYGTFEYMVHSFCSRILKYESDTLSMEKFEQLENLKNDYLDSSGQSFEKALELYEPDETDTDERWLQYYILGKIAEKKRQEPNEYLQYYLTALDLLKENKAQYPDKIIYHTPQLLSVEILEMHYRIYACILKYIELHEGKPISTSVGKMFKRSLITATFPKKKSPPVVPAQPPEVLQPKVASIPMSDQSQAIVEGSTVVAAEIAASDEPQIQQPPEDLSKATSLKLAEVEPSVEKPVEKPAAQTSVSDFSSAFHKFIQNSVSFDGDVLDDDSCEEITDDKDVKMPQGKDEKSKPVDPKDSGTVVENKSQSSNVVEDDVIILLSDSDEDQTKRDNENKKEEKSETNPDPIHADTELPSSKVTSGASQEGIITIEESFRKEQDSAIEPKQDKLSECENISEQKTDSVKEDKSENRVVAKTINALDIFDKMMEETMKKSFEQQPMEVDFESAEVSCIEIEPKGIKSDKDNNEDKSTPLEDKQKETDPRSNKEEVNVNKSEDKQASKSGGSETDGTNKKSSDSSSSSSSSSDSSSSDSDSDDESSSSSSSSADEAHDTLTSSEIGHFVNLCISGLEQCIIRLPQNFKALYRLAHLYFHYKPKKELNKCKQLLLGEYKCKNNEVVSGLFADRRANNFFNSIWRIPSTEIDRPGSLSAHMSRCITLLLQILRTTNDHKILMELCLQFKKAPDQDKIYIKDSERLQFSEQALTMCMQCLQSQVKNLSNLNNASVQKLLQDIFKVYHKVQKHMPSMESKFANMLSDVYKTCMKDKIPENFSPLDMAIKYCLQNRSHKSKSTQQAPVPLPRNPGQINPPVLPTPSTVAPPANPLKKPGSGRPRGRPPLPKIPGQTRTPRGKSPSVSTSYPWQQQQSLPGMDPKLAVEYLKHYQEELIKQYSHLPMTQLSTLGQCFTQGQLSNPFMQSLSQSSLLNSGNLAKQMPSGMGALSNQQLSEAAAQITNVLNKSPVPSSSLPSSVSGLTADQLQLLSTYVTALNQSAKTATSKSLGKGIPATSAGLFNPYSVYASSLSTKVKSASSDLKRSGSSSGLKYTMASKKAKLLTSSKSSSGSVTKSSSSIQKPIPTADVVRSSPSMLITKVAVTGQSNTEPVTTKSLQAKTNFDKQANQVMKDRPNISITPIIPSTPPSPLLQTTPPPPIATPPFVLPQSVSPNTGMYVPPTSSPGKTLQEKLADKQKQISSKQSVKSFDDIIPKDLNIIPVTSGMKKSQGGGNVIGSKTAMTASFGDGGLTISQVSSKPYTKLKEKRKESTSKKPKLSLENLTVSQSFLPYSGMTLSPKNKETTTTSKAGAFSVPNIAATITPVGLDAKKLSQQKDFSTVSSHKTTPGGQQIKDSQEKKEAVNLSGCATIIRKDYQPPKKENIVSLPKVEPTSQQIIENFGLSQKHYESLLKSQEYINLQTSVANSLQASAASAAKKSHAPSSKPESFSFTSMHENFVDRSHTKQKSDEAKFVQKPETSSSFKKVDALVNKSDYNPVNKLDVRPSQKVEGIGFTSKASSFQESLNALQKYSNFNPVQKADISNLYSKNLQKPDNFGPMPVVSSSSKKSDFGYIQKADSTFAYSKFENLTLPQKTFPSQTSKNESEKKYGSAISPHQKADVQRSTSFNPTRKLDSFSILPKKESPTGHYKKESFNMPYTTQQLNEITSLYSTYSQKDTTKDLLKSQQHKDVITPKFSTANKQDNFSLSVSSTLSNPQQKSPYGITSYPDMAYKFDSFGIPQSLSQHINVSLPSYSQYSSIPSSILQKEFSNINIPYSSSQSKPDNLHVTYSSPTSQHKKELGGTYASHLSQHKKELGGTHSSSASQHKKDLGVAYSGSGPTSHHQHKKELGGTYSSPTSHHKKELGGTYPTPTSHHKKELGGAYSSSSSSSQYKKELGGAYSSPTSQHKKELGYQSSKIELNLPQSMSLKKDSYSTTPASYLQKTDAFARQYQLDRDIYGSPSLPSQKSFLQSQMIPTHGGDFFEGENKLPQGLASFAAPLKAAPVSKDDAHVKKDSQPKAVHKAHDKLILNTDGPVFSQMKDELLKPKDVLRLPPKKDQAKLMASTLSSSIDISPLPLSLNKRPSEFAAENKNPEDLSKPKRKSSDDVIVVE